MPELAMTIACSIVATRIDYCNSLPYGAPAATFDALQRVQNILAHVVTHSGRRSSAKPLLELLCWLPVHQRVTYRLATLCYRQDRHRHQRIFSHCLYRTSPLYHCCQATHQGWPFLELEQFLPAVLSLSLHRPFGTHCQTMSSTRTP